MRESAALTGAEGRVIDESLEQHVRNVERRRREARAKAGPDPRSAAHVARFTIEEIALQLHFREIGPTSERQLDKVLKRLADRGVIPGKDCLQFGTVQHHGNFWVHAQLGAGEPSARDLETLLSALDRVVEWYIAGYLKLDVASVVRPSGRPGGPPPAPPDTTPTTFTSVAATVGTRWLEGELVPMWRGRRGDGAGRLLLTVADGDAARQLELRIDAARPCFVGRRSMRRDGQTPNDLVVPIGDVSHDQAVVELVDGRVVLRNTGSKANVAVGVDWLAPGSSRPLHHRVPVRFGSAAGVFLDGRLYEGAPESAVDPATGLLAREGLGCEIALTLAGRRNKVAFFARYSPDDEGATRRAALLLHEREPGLAAARVRNVAVLVCDRPESMKEDMEARLGALVGARLAPSVAGFLPLVGESRQADACIEAALGALARLAAAGVGCEHAVDLARYAIPSAKLRDLAAQAADTYPAGGGVVVFVLDEVERLVEMSHPAHAAVELEFREMLGAALGPADLISPVADGVLAVLTHDSVEQLAREQPAKWRARGPVQVGALELDRCVRALPLPPESIDALVANGPAFVREEVSGVDSRVLPAPIACAMEEAKRAADPACRIRAVVAATEASWQLVACLLAAAHRQRFRSEQIAPTEQGGWGQPWLAIASEAARRLREGDDRVAELARATHELATGGALVSTSAAAAAALATAEAPGVGQDALDRAFEAANEALRATLAGLRPLRGWSLVAVRATEALDIDGRSLRVDYTDFSGPHPTGAPGRDTVTGLRLNAFVYFARWAEEQMVVLEPWIRRARNPQTGSDELFLIQQWPTAPGSYRYRAATATAEIELEVTARHLGR